jgi:uncharacterized protein (DUF885 family)
MIRAGWTTILALSLSASGCSEWTPPAPPPVATIPVPPGVASPKPTAAPAPALSSFAALRDRIVDRWLAEDPSLGRAAGLHAFDGKLADYSASGLAARLARVQKDRDALAAVDARSLTADEALDRALLLQRADLALFSGRDLDAYRKDPGVYEELFSVNGYLDRDYAPIVERAERLLAHEEAALSQIDHVQKNLASTLAKPVAETNVKRYAGFAEYLRKDVPRQLAGVGSPAFQERLARTNGALAAAAESLRDRLKAAAKDDGSHVLGPERYRKLLVVQEGLTLPLAELGRMGEDNLKAEKKAYEALVKKGVKLTPLTAATTLDEARRLTEAARRFIVEKKLVTIPDAEAVTVTVTPPFMRWNAAFLDAPGAFEERPLPGFYYITPPDPTWSKKEQDDYLMPRGILLSTTIHEVDPGHFLQAKWQKRAPTRAQKLFSSYSFVEGWAHYGERMMIEEGFGAETDESRLGQLSDALLRSCRVVVSLGVHTARMTMKEAERRFVSDCKQDRATAREQAARAAFDPGYFAYTLGKIQILALRDEARKRLGARFSLQRFHDALLSHGAPPVPLLRERVLRDLGAE